MTSDTVALAKELSYFLVPHADMQGNTTRINNLLLIFNDEIGKAPQAEQWYYYDVLEKIESLLNQQHFSPANVLRTELELQMFVACPNAQDSVSHVKGWSDAMNIVMASYLLTGQLNAIDMSGKSVPITGLSATDRELLYTSIYTSFTNLSYNMAQNKGQFSADSYATIAGVLADPTVIADIHTIFECSRTPGMDPDPSVLNDLSAKLSLIVTSFNTIPVKP
ncbi:MAG: hypothetical protein JSS32_08125 [Verrucomicrobia bacterium]|nr:hypothetical protein [Verrucomicrobiota bacterium]